MANNLENHDAYIIIGVEDKTFKILGVEEDQNRKNTQNIVDFLKDKKFAGDIRPTVKVETVKIDDKELDVIIIKNTFNTPYYLKEQFSGVYANNIYTRIQDTNTSINKSADIDKVEYLWKKRFGLLQSPIDKFLIYLKDYANWENNPYTEMSKYYKNCPEYTLCYESDENRKEYEYYHFFQMDSTPNYLCIKLYYHQTLLREYPGVCLDNGRYVTPCPLTDDIEINGQFEYGIIFKYYEKNSFLYAVHKFLYLNERDGSCESTYKRFLKGILIFENEQERVDFKYYAKEHWGQDEAKYSNVIHPPYIPEELEKRYKKNFFKNECENVLILNEMLKDFRNENLS